MQFLWEPKHTSGSLRLGEHRHRQHDIAARDEAPLALAACRGKR